MKHRLRSCPATWYIGDLEKLFLHCAPCQFSPLSHTHSQADCKRNEDPYGKQRKCVGINLGKRATGGPGGQLGRLHNSASLRRDCSARLAVYLLLWWPMPCLCQLPVRHLLCLLPILHGSCFCCILFSWFLVQAFMPRIQQFTVCIYQYIFCTFCIQCVCTLKERRLEAIVCRCASTVEKVCKCLPGAHACNMFGSLSWCATLSSRVSGCMAIWRCSHMQDAVIYTNIFI